MMKRSLLRRRAGTPDHHHRRWWRMRRCAAAADRWTTTHNKTTRRTHGATSSEAGVQALCRIGIPLCVSHIIHFEHACARCDCPDGQSWGCSIPPQNSKEAHVRSGREKETLGDNPQHAGAARRGALSHHDPCAHFTTRQKTHSFSINRRRSLGGGVQGHEELLLRCLHRWSPLQRPCRHLLIVSGTLSTICFPPLRAHLLGRVPGLSRRCDGILP